MSKNGVHVLGLLLLTQCSAYVSHSARDKLLGMTAPDLVSCAGKPDAVMQVKPDVLVAEWSSKSAAAGAKSGFSVTLPLGASLTLPASTASCHMQATVLRDGTVASIALSSTTGVLDDDGSCAGLVAECVFHPDSTGLPKGYDAFTYFLPSTPTPPSSIKSASKVEK
jgi:hypothetical protein